VNLDQALETYVHESRDLLQQMEELLLAFSQGRTDPESVNALFRAAHTIKGSAGLFGLDDIVHFTHVVESALDLVRDGKLAMTPDLAALLLACRDHMGHLVEAAASGSALDQEAIRIGADLQSRLGSHLGEVHGAPHPIGTALGAASDPAVDDGAYWHISVRFGRDVLRNGMDPLSFIRYLATLGRIVAMTTLSHEMPKADEMDPESCYLGFEIGLESAAAEAAIEAVFDFVRDDCVLRILPPGSEAAEYVALIEALPAEEARVGDLLVRCGALTIAQLDAALGTQSAEAAGMHDAGQRVRRIGDILVDQKAVARPVVEAAIDKQKQAREGRSQESRFLRVDADKLDRLINQIGELVIAGAGINLVAKRTGAADLLEAASTLGTLVEDVRDSALQLRMVPIGATFNRFQRVVHDVAKELGKDIALVVNGGDTELDKTMVERIADPLMHLVRNAMDHGIEPTDVRLEHGKPPHGTVTLNAYHDSGGIVIEVGDDGGGLKTDRILEKAIARGLIAEGGSPTRREIHELIFAPGFSTASQISNLSGRGVGMDVVKSSVTELRGTVEVDSREGEGTTIRIRLPLTLAIIDGFLVGVSGSVLVVPLDMVEECIEFTDAARQEANGREFVNLRGQVLPFIQIRDLFEIDGQAARRENILVVRYAGQRAGLVVDELLGEAQTVIKPLGKLFRKVTGIGGSTILGDGRVALILDIPDLLRHVHDEAGHRDSAPVR
jgi:two-component system, chemotaxis family, sensor kinase CheA